MSYRVLGLPQFAAAALTPDAQRAVGEVRFHETPDHTVSAVRVDTTTVIDSVMLDWVRHGSVAGMSLTGDRVVLDLDNGHWEYQIGDYSPTYQGIVLDLVEGAPLRPVTNG